MAEAQEAGDLSAFGEAKTCKDRYLNPGWMKRDHQHELWYCKFRAFCKEYLNIDIPPIHEPLHPQCATHMKSFMRFHGRKKPATELLYRKNEEGVMVQRNVAVLGMLLPFTLGNKAVWLGKLKEGLEWFLKKGKHPNLFLGGTRDASLCDEYDDLKKKHRGKYSYETKHAKVSARANN
jgi:hypothetical protein